MSGKRQRDLLRVIHLVTSGFTAFYLYSPLGGADLVRLVMQAAIFPLMMLSGVWMWQQARLRRLVNGTKADAPPRRAVGAGR